MPGIYPMDFDKINSAALSCFESLLCEWLPSGRRDGHEFVALNPTRSDRKAGSFRININSGVWADFATNDSGKDPVSLVAYLRGIKMGEAGRIISDRLALPV
jgi:putative DNA primase/helicase